MGGGLEKLDLLSQGSGLGRGPEPQPGSHGGFLKVRYLNNSHIEVSIES